MAVPCSTWAVTTPPRARSPRPSRRSRRPAARWTAARTTPTRTSPRGRDRGSHEVGARGRAGVEVRGSSRSRWIDLHPRHRDPRGRLPVRHRRAGGVRTGSEVRARCRGRGQAKTPPADSTTDADVDRSKDDADADVTPEGETEAHQDEPESEAKSEEAPAAGGSTSTPGTEIPEGGSPVRHRRRRRSPHRQRSPSPLPSRTPDEDSRRGPGRRLHHRRRRRPQQGRRRRGRDAGRSTPRSERRLRTRTSSATDSGSADDAPLDVAARHQGQVRRRRRLDRGHRHGDRCRGQTSPRRPLRSDDTDESEDEPTSGDRRTTPTTKPRPRSRSRSRPPRARRTSHGRTPRSARAVRCSTSEQVVAGDPGHLSITGSADARFSLHRLPGEEPWRSTSAHSILDRTGRSPGCSRHRADGGARPGGARRNCQRVPAATLAPAAATTTWKPRPAQYTRPPSPRTSPSRCPTGSCCAATSPCRPARTARRSHQVPVVVTITAYNKTVIAGGFGGEPGRRRPGVPGQARLRPAHRRRPRHRHARRASGARSAPARTRTPAR